MSETENKQLALHGDHGMGINVGFMVTRTIEDAIKISEIIANSGVCPNAYKGKPNDVLVAMQMGAEVGLKPMQALQNIAVINGRPSIWGDAMLAICRQSNQFEYISERYIKESNGYICIVKRRNEPEFQQVFDESDAKKAGLWGKQGPWSQYPKRMLQMRARGFALRDSFPDLLRGILTAEEAHDYPSEKIVDHSGAVGNVVEGKAEQTPEYVNDEQLEILRSKLLQSESNETDICNFAKVDTLECLPANQWGNIVRLLDKKIIKNNKEKSLKDLAANKGSPDVNDTTVDDYFAQADTDTGEVKSQAEEVANKL